MTFSITNSSIPGPLDDKLRAASSMFTEEAEPIADWAETVCKSLWP